MVWALVRLVTGVQTRVRGPRTRTRRLSLSAIPAAVVLVILLHLVAGKGFWRALVVASPAVRMVGAVILVGSLAFTLWARRALGLVWSSASAVKAGHELSRASAGRGGGRGGSCRLNRFLVLVRGRREGRRDGAVVRRQPSSVSTWPGGSRRSIPTRTSARSTAFW